MVHRGLKVLNIFAVLIIGFCASSVLSAPDEVSRPDSVNNDAVSMKAANPASAGTVNNGAVQELPGPDNNLTRVFSPEIPDNPANVTVPPVTGVPQFVFNSSSDHSSEPPVVSSSVIPDHSEAPLSKEVTTTTTTTTPYPSTVTVLGNVTETPFNTSTKKPSSAPPLTTVSVLFIILPVILSVL